MTRGGLPILVGGCFRSGTTLVRRLLNAHSRIHCGPEVKFFRDFYGDYQRDELAHLRFLGSARAIVDDDDLLAIVGRAFIALHERAAARAGKTRWADKNPENVLYVDAWRRLLGDGFCFVHVVRPPFATIASMREANFRLTIPADLDGQIDLYRRYNEAGLAIAARFPERTLRVSYDRLVARPRPELARLMTWLGEVPEDGQLDFGRLPLGDGLQDPKSATTTGVHRESVERWRALLDSSDIESIGRRTSELWQRLTGADQEVA
jgi:hypothetical protein